MLRLLPQYPKSEPTVTFELFVKASSPGLAFPLNASHLALVIVARNPALKAFQGYANDGQSIVL